MIGKLLLPRLGGTPAVWNTCMLFFQVCVLGGYAYAHLIATRVPLRVQSVLHLALLAGALLTLPIGFGHIGRPPVDRNPIPWLLAALAMSAGPAFFVVSSNAPLLQRWFATTGRDPYFLYAASNVGSLIALLAYPLFIEPRLRLAQQAQFWTWLYLALIALVTLCAVRLRGSSPTPAQSASGGPAPPADPHFTRTIQLRWIAFAFVPSSYLLGVTSFISSDIAAVPLMWVVPLALYLLSFILVFAAWAPIPHRWVLRLLPPTVLAAVMIMMARAAQPVWLVLCVHFFAFFIAAMACHGELARRRPPPERLTHFYLMLSLGGALGGAFNAVLAPWIFNRPLEYPIAIALTCLLALPHRTDARAPGTARESHIQRVLDLILPLMLCVFGFVVTAMIPARTVPQTLPIILIFLTVPILICWTFASRPRRFALGVAALLTAVTLLPPAKATLLDVRRSFFGVHRTLRARDERGNVYNYLFHGTTMHGAQRVDATTGRPTAPDEPTSYYYPGSPYAQAFAAAVAKQPSALSSSSPAAPPPPSPPPPPLPRVGVAGLGGGSLAGFARQGWHVTFFEIDPAVVWTAEHSGHFTFVPAARQRGATVQTVLGDARLTIGQQPDQSFDLLALDAFNGDGIPVHLLTREAVAMYLMKLRGDGILIVHISNLYLDLEPVVAALAADAKCVALVRDENEPPKEHRDRGATGSRVAVLARSPHPLAPLAQDARWRPLHASPHVQPWTDDFSNLVQIVRWTRPPG